jgi:hypothetical protein
MKLNSRPGRTAFVTAFFLAAFSGRAQQGLNDELNSIHGNFQIDAQYYEPDSLIGAPKVPEKFLSNAFGNINYSRGKFSAGVRYEAYNNVRQGFDSRYKGQGITNRFARYSTDLLDITIGNIYEQFGSGLMFRTYYEPGLLYDNSLDGIRIISSPVRGVTLKGLTGKQRSFFTVGPGVVRGADAEINVNEIFDSILGDKKTRVILGGSFVSKYQPDESSTLNLPENVGCYGGRLNVIRGGFNFFGEYAYKINDPSKDNGYSYKSGDALFLTASYATTGFSLLLQGKRIDNMSYRSDREASLQNLLINYLPATTKQHSYTMLALNPYATQLKGEIGFMAEAQYKIKKNSPLGGKYGMEITVNYSQANGLKQIYVNDDSTAHTLYKTDWKFEELTGISSNSNDSLINLPPQRRHYKYYHDFFIEINKKFSKKWKASFIYANQYYNRDVVQEGTILEAFKILEANIGVIDVTYKYKSSSSIRLEVQGLFVEDQEVVTNSNLVARGNWATALLEWSPNGHWFVALYDQYNYGNPDPKLKVHYYLGTIGYNKDAHRIAVSYGKQSAGIFCVGGVCRTVPASNGITLSITSSF